MIRTERLLLRQWTDDDLDPFAQLNADPEVMRHFPAPLARPQSDVLAAVIRSRLDRDGWGLWAVEVTDATSPLKGHFIGFTGLTRQTFPAHFTPAIEVGWRLARHAWGNGFATEAARAAIAHGFTRLGLNEIVSMAALGNIRSRAVMERLGMTHDPGDDFEHPQVPQGSPLRAHVLYRLSAR
ncbi:MAG: acetyltransferase, family protein [Microbacteriaceae bacterium]|nr:acetyltransferase, family protein [Microbacteriaceae bacterium]HEV7956982.1 GNAT family N-acetyltransferase [Marisediminicola sp.]